MNGLWLLVPVKGLDKGKSRLAKTLTFDQRAELTRQILQRTLALGAAVDAFAEMLVISTDPMVHALARTAGARSLCEATSGLNQALSQARTCAVEHGAEAILVLPSDLPFFTADDLTDLVRLAEAGSQMVIAPSGDGGTNALLLAPPRIVDFAFGPGSFQRHCDAARDRGARASIVHSPSLAFDVDWPSDLRYLNRRRPELSSGSIVPR